MLNTSEKRWCFYFVRRVPYDLAITVKPYFYSKTKSLLLLFVLQINFQRLEDYWLGLRLQNMDIPAIQVVKSIDPC